MKPDWDRIAALHETLREHMAIINADKALLRQALEALEWEYGGEPLGKLTHDTIIALRERLGKEET